MTQYPPSTIAQLMFEQMPRKTLPALVRELDEALADKGSVRQISWDNDDIVFLDVNGTRVGLGYFEYPVADYSACLIITAGPIPGSPPNQAEAQTYYALCRRIATRANIQLQADGLIWHEIADPVTCDVVDQLVEMLEPAQPTATRHCGTLCPSFATVHPTHSPALDFRPRGAVQNPILIDSIAKPQESRPVARTGTRPFAADADVAKLRLAFDLDEEDGVHTNAQRAAAHAMNATLAIMVPPLGAGLLAASYRYGANLKHSARAMGAAGALIGLAQSAAASNIVSFLPI